MKKIILVAICVLLIAAGIVFVATGKNTAKLVCGVTEFEPMNFRDVSGKWRGFDTELAQLVGQKLKMAVEFREIDWGNKYQELNAGNITCIWNGFTANSSDNGVRRSELVDFTYSYLRNQQCIVIRAARSGELRSTGDLAGKTATAESGSAGEETAKETIGDTGKFIGAAAQINTFVEVKSGAADFAVVDVLFAQRMAGSGEYSDLRIADITLDFEVYAVGFKKGSHLRDKVNKALIELLDEGKMLDLAKKYYIENSLVLDTNFRG
jgi:polar amino acid transport system substrate-binding protein